jgi:hypothetical protein
MDFIRRARVEIAGQEKRWCIENRKSVEADTPCDRKQELLARRVVGHEGIVGPHHSTVQCLLINLERFRAIGFNQ